MPHPTNYPMSEIPQTRQSLLLELGRRSDDAWAEFLQVYENAIYAVCRSKGLQDADARDVTQDVLAAVHQRIPTWDHDASRGSFRGWLMRVARNLVVDFVSQRARRATGSGDSKVERLLEEFPDGELDPGTGFDLEYQRSVFAWAAEKVRAEVRDVTWQAFQLATVQGMAADQIAEQLGISIGSVYTAKCRVVARIRSRAEGLQGEST